MIAWGRWLLVAQDAPEDGGSELFAGGIRFVLRPDALRPRCVCGSKTPQAVCFWLEISASSLSRPALPRRP
jgi:hypothetical protein